MGLKELTSNLWKKFSGADLWDKTAVVALPIDWTLQVLQDNFDLGPVLNTVMDHSGNFFPIFYISGAMRNMFYGPYQAVALATSLGVGVEVAQHFDLYPGTGEPIDALTSLVAGSASLLMARRYGGKYNERSRF